MYFEGDIIITDPCYFIKETCSQAGPAPKMQDYMRYPKKSEYPDVKNKIQGLEILKEPVLCEMLMQSDMYTEDREKYLIALRKYEEENEDDWERSDFGEDLNVLGFSTYLSSETLYGDWCCNVFDLNNDNKIIGEFCADAGMVAVVLMKELLNYNPDYDDYIKYPHTATVIKDFKGDVDFVIKNDELKVVGHGNNLNTGVPIDFIGKQTRL